MINKRTLLVFSASKSPAHGQFIKGIFQNVNKVRKNKGYKWHPMRLKKISELFKFSYSGNKLILYSPSLKNIMILILSRILGIDTFYWLHEPYPFIFVLKRRSSTNIQIIRSFFLSYLYNPIVFLLSNNLILSSLNGEQLLFSNILGIFLKILKRKIIYIPLPIDNKVYSFTKIKKKNQIFVLASLNKDKTIHYLYQIAKKNQDFNFLILAQNNVYKKLIESSKVFVDLYSLDNVYSDNRNYLSDALIYRLIASCRFIILPYKHITQTGFLPAAFATGTIPLVSNTLAFRDACFGVSNNVIVLDEKVSLSKQIKNLNIVKSRKSLISFSKKYREEVYQKFKMILSY